jgi:hypothetical protein
MGGLSRIGQVHVRQVAGQVGVGQRANRISSASRIEA